MNKARFEAFSDGVFAFAITLLILGIALPAFRNPPSDRELAYALLRLWPNLLAYILSFAVIGIMWQNHHALFRLVERVDRWTVFLNLMLLGVTVFIPFATSTLGAYPSMRSSTFLYGLTLTSSGTVYNLMLAHLLRSGALHPNVSKATIRQTVVAYRVGVVTYAVAMLTSLVEPAVSFALYLFVAGYYLFPRGVDADIAGKPVQG
ncbi:MAG TPA: TMEM175 family protein [Candidatus Acidoferrales bacterium]|nr:TMEM175 family protein [Candidatus Acidoferrales bacterium]